MSYQFNPQTKPEDFAQLLGQVDSVDIFQDPRWLEVSSGKGWDKSQIFSLSNEAGEILIGASGYINSSTGFGKYLYIQHGPLIRHTLLVSKTQTPAQTWAEADFLNQQAQQICREFFTQLHNYSRAHGYFALIIEPISLADSAVAQLLTELGYLPQRWSILPKHPMYIDLSQTEAELLAKLEKNTRYNIRYAQKQGVTIEFIYPDQVNINSALEIFYGLLQEAAEHKSYGLPAKSFFTAAVKAYQGTNNLCFALAYYNGEVISANFSQFFGKWASSYYTANSRRQPKLRASYLLKWATILEAKRQGKAVFDMWGQIPGLAKNHPEYGYGQFKRSFNPIEKTLVGRVILPLNPAKYFAWKLLGRVRYLLKH